MEIPELQKHIVSKDIPAFLILTGKEVGVLDIYLDRIRATATAVETYDTVQEAFQRMCRQSMAATPRLFIVRGDDAFVKQEKAWEAVVKQTSKMNSLLLVFSTLDKRGKFYKQYVDSVVEFETLAPALLCKYIDHVLQGLPNDDKLELIDVCEQKYSRILLECDKIKQYVDAKKAQEGVSISVSAAFQQLLQEGVIFTPVGDITFLLSDAILTRNAIEAIRYLQQARSKGEPEILILSLLYTGFRNMLMVQGLGNDTSDICKRTGLTSWQVKMSRDKMGGYSIGELVSALKITRFAEMGIKTGVLDADVAIEYVMANIL